MTNHILKNDGKTLQNLFQKLEKLNELNQIFAQYVEPGIVPHCKVANLQNNCLIVIVDNGSWATQLRFHIPDLIVKLRNHSPLSNLKAICCKTRPDPKLKAPMKKRRQPFKPISFQTAQSMQKSAEQIKDKKLRELMLKIMNRMI